MQNLVALITMSEEMAEILESKTGIEVVLGTHDYH